MHCLSVRTPGGRYPIVVGRGLIGDGRIYGSLVRGPRVLVVSNEVVAPLYLEPVIRALEPLNPTSIVLPDGEATKTLASFSQIIDTLIERGYHRDATLVALGGGVTGDLTGFAAACFQRGIDCLQVPTTLLAQVDSSVGGKTAVNHAAGKNLIGAFHQPVGVIADVDTLRTLSEREYLAGVAEVIKYGIGVDGEFFAWLEDQVQALLDRDPGALEDAIVWSCATKARIVAEDERERGSRALLNLGHTFAHAVEAEHGYTGKWLHGEAVAVGMRMATVLARELGLIEPEGVRRILALLSAARLPSVPPTMTVSRWRELMARDKKVAGGRVRLVLPTGIGASTVMADYADDVLDRLLAGEVSLDGPA
jgi:3-dehydroquinate synthase